MATTTTTTATTMTKATTTTATRRIRKKKTWPLTVSFVAVWTFDTSLAKGQEEKGKKIQHKTSLETSQ